MDLIRDCLDRDADSRQAQPEFGNVLEAVVRNWAAVVEDIPTRYLGQCIDRALRTKTDTFPLAAYALTKAYEELRPELERLASEEAARRELLRLTGPKPVYIGRAEFRRLHNLPPTWKLGDPIPSEDATSSAPIDTEQHESTQNEGEKGR